jgi:hypothetical protein
MDHWKHTEVTDKAVKGGFGAQVTSTGRPSVIAPIKHLPVSFEEFMKDPEPLIIRNYNGKRKVNNECMY